MLTHSRVPAVSARARMQTMNRRRKLFELTMLAMLEGTHGSLARHATCSTAACAHSRAHPP